jgi:hypothetical protein
MDLTFVKDDKVSWLRRRPIGVEGSDKRDENSADDDDTYSDEACFVEEWSSSFKLVSSRGFDSRSIGIFELRRP